MREYLNKRTDPSTSLRLLNTHNLAMMRILCFCLLFVLCVASCQTTHKNKWELYKKPHSWWQTFFSSRYSSLVIQAPSEQVLTQSVCIVGLVYKLPRFQAPWVIYSSNFTKRADIPTVGSSQYILASDNAVSYLVSAETCHPEDAGLMAMVFDKKGVLLGVKSIHKKIFHEMPDRDLAILYHGSNSARTTHSEEQGRTNSQSSATSSTSGSP